MAGVITHMVIAREINKRLPEGTIADMGLFYLGNLAPDAIHAREGYKRAYKKHTHFRDDILDKEFAKEENLTLFYNRVTVFINEFYHRGDGLQDLYRGYIAHILADELYLLTVREHFCRTMEKQGIDQGDPDFFEYIVGDMTRNDFILVQDYEGMDEIRESMEKVPIYPVEGYLSEKELNTCRDWLLWQHFYMKSEILEPRYIQPEETMEFIQMAAEDIIKRLSEGTMFPKMF